MLNILLIVTGLITAILLVSQVVVVSRQHRVSRKKAPLLNVACAGSVRPNAPDKKQVVNLQWDKLAPEDVPSNVKKNVEYFITAGRSMLLGGIENNDLVIVDLIKKSMELTLPAIVVLKRDENAIAKALMVGDHAEYKIRRSWTKCNLGQSDEEILEMVQNIIQSDKFKELRSKDEEKFPAESDLINDFKERLYCYRMEHTSCNNKNNDNYFALLSTTLDTTQEKVHFSIHSYKMLVGKVRSAYKISDIGNA